MTQASNVLIHYSVLMIIELLMLPSTLLDDLFDKRPKIFVFFDALSVVSQRLHYRVFRSEVSGHINFGLEH
jgi:hypothetical protein